MAIQISSMDRHNHHNNPQEAEELISKSSSPDQQHSSSISSVNNNNKSLLPTHNNSTPKAKPNRLILTLRNRLVRWCYSSANTTTNAPANNNKPYNNNSNANTTNNTTSTSLGGKNLSVCLVGTLLVCLSTHRVVSLIMTHRRWINAPITYMNRQCPATGYETLPDALLDASSSSSSWTMASSSLQATPPSATPISAIPNENGAIPSSYTTATPNALKSLSDLKICITTLTDQKSPSTFQRFVRWRNFDGILDLTWPNKQMYAKKHQYHLFDGSRHIDTSRPPAWSKIKAVQHLMKARDEVDDQGNSGEACDWVVWTDADTVVMNSTIRITDFLPSDPTKDLVVASDKGGGYNSGVFLFRNSQWSKDFLRAWWNMKDFVRPPGFSLSGDNAALKAYLQTLHDLNEFDSHVLVPPRCTMNSFAQFLTITESLDIMDHLTEKTWHMDNEHYHKGDFIAHIPGVDNKAECLKLLLAEAL